MAGCRRCDGGSAVWFRAQTVVVAQRFELCAYGGTGSGEIAQNVVGINVIAEHCLAYSLRYGIHGRQSGCEFFGCYFNVEFVMEIFPSAE